MSSSGPDPDLDDPVRYHASGERDVPTHDRWLTRPEAERLESMRFTKRRDESRLGRWTAKHAVARALGVSQDPERLRAIVISNATDGAPRAYLDDRPAPVAISMTDRAGWAVCTVASGVEAIGCDLELVEPRSSLFVTDYFTRSEQVTVATGRADRDLLANLIWSAKESALKVLHEGLRLDTRSVEVALGGEQAAGWSSMTVTTTTGARFPGWWTRFDQFVLTYCATEPTRPPAAMDDPSPLSVAVPLHSWVAKPLRPDRGSS